MYSVLLTNGNIQIVMTQVEGAAILSQMKELDDLDSVTERLVDEIESCIDEPDEDDYEDDFEDEDEDEEDEEHNL